MMPLCYSQAFVLPHILFQNWMGYLINYVGNPKTPLKYIHGIHRARGSKWSSAKELPRQKIVRILKLMGTGVSFDALLQSQISADGLFNYSLFKSLKILFEYKEWDL